MKTILASIDFSPVTERVVDQAVALAQAVGASLELIHAVQPPVVVTDLAPFVGEVVQFTDEIERGSKRRLKQLQERLAARGVEVTTYCTQGYPVRVILERAREVAAEFIVLGSHGHTAFYDLIVGSTASGVLKGAACPVVVVPAEPKKTGNARGPVRKRRAVRLARR
jgi:nucleotide-binding universal stress UspA family protein